MSIKTKQRVRKSKRTSKENLLNNYKEDLGEDFDIFNDLILSTGLLVALTLKINNDELKSVHPNEMVELFILSYNMSLEKFEVDISTKVKILPYSMDFFMKCCGLITT